MELLLRALSTHRLRLVRALRRVLRRPRRRRRKIVRWWLLASSKVFNLIVTTEDTPVVIKASLLRIRIIETLSLYISFAPT